MVGRPIAGRSFFCALGLGLTAAFFLLRAINVYGDTVRRSTEKSAAFTVLSFLNTNEYPPSLLFLTDDARPRNAFPGAAGARTPQWLRPALVFGEVPMFYYLLHIPLLHLLAVIVCYARYGQVHWMFESPTVGQFPITPPPGWGFSLPIVCLVWAFVVSCFIRFAVGLHPRSRRRSDAWLSYF
jgi:uncharacterized membrane protein